MSYVCRASYVLRNCRKSSRPDLTRLAMAAGCAVRRGIVTTERQIVVNAELQPFLYDVGLAQVNQRRVNRQALLVFDAGFRREICHPLKGGDVFWAAVGIARVVECIDADEDVLSAQDLGPREREGQEDG